MTVDDAGAADDLLTALGGLHRHAGRHQHRGPAVGVHAAVRAGAVRDRQPGDRSVVETDEPLALPAQRNGSGRWAAVPDDDEADEREPDAAPAPAVERGRSPAALVSIGGAAAAVAVVSTLFLWPAPRTTNSAISRPCAARSRGDRARGTDGGAHPDPNAHDHPPAAAGAAAHPAGRRAPAVGRGDDAHPDRVRGSERVRDDLHATVGIGIDRTPVDHHDDQEAGGRLRGTSGPAETGGDEQQARTREKGPFRIPERALLEVAPTGFEPALPP